MNLGRADVSGQLKRLFDLTGRVDVDLATTISPVVNVFDLDDPPYHSKRGGCARLVVGAVAGQHSTVCIGLPSTVAENVRLIVRRFDVLSTTAWICSGMWSTVGVVTVREALDWEQGVSMAGALRRAAHVDLRSGTTAIPSAGGEFWVGTAAANVQREFEGPLVLMPGTYITLQLTAVNIELYTNLYWDTYEV